MRGVDASPVRQVRVSFDEFYASTFDRSVKTATFLTQDPAAGEEVAQDAYAKMLPTFVNADEPAAYLRTCIVNGARTWHRRHRLAQSKLPLLYRDARHVDFVATELADAVAALPFRQRTVIVLRYYEDLSEAEIAAALGCRPGTVKSLASRALAQLSKDVPK